MQAYCMKCRTKREMTNATPTTMKNGRPALQGTCEVCGTKMYRIRSQADAPATDVPENQAFWCHDGRTIRNLRELADALNIMSEETYSHHVSGSNNDFANWVANVILDEGLSQSLRAARSPRQAAETVEAKTP